MRKQAGLIIAIQKLKYKENEKCITHDEANKYEYDYYDRIKFEYNK